MKHLDDIIDIVVQIEAASVTGTSGIGPIGDVDLMRRQKRLRRYARNGVA